MYEIVHFLFIIIFLVQKQLLKKIFTPPRITSTLRKIIINKAVKWNPILELNFFYGMKKINLDVLGHNIRGV